MKRRRFPHLAREEGSDPLEILRSLPPGEAQDFERLLARQHRGDATFGEVQTVASALPGGGFEGFLDGRSARAVATGGGRRRPTRAPAE